MTLKDQLYSTLHRNTKPLKLIAEEIGVSENYLYRSALPDADESETGTGCRFPLKLLPALIRSTGNFAVLDFIEQSLGRVAFTLPSPDCRLSDICRLAMIAVKEFGELMAEMEASIADNILAEDEKTRITKEGYDALQAINSLLESVQREKK